MYLTRQYKPHGTPNPRPVTNPINPSQMALWRPGVNVGARGSLEALGIGSLDELRAFCAAGAASAKELALLGLAPKQAELLVARVQVPKGPQGLAALAFFFTFLSISAKPQNKIEKACLPFSSPTFFSCTFSLSFGCVWCCARGCLRASHS